jgi:hypothetical protein
MAEFRNTKTKLLRRLQTNDDEEEEEEEDDDGDGDGDDITHAKLKSL